MSTPSREFWAGGYVLTLSPICCFALFSVFGLNSDLFCGLYSDKDAQMCIYDASLETHFGFCCDIDEQTSLELARTSLNLFIGLPLRELQRRCIFVFLVLLVLFGA